jgi:hypothetical protein
MNGSQSSSELLLNADDLAMFHHLRINDELLLKYDVRRVSDVEARTDLGLRGSHIKDFSGIAFLYHDPKTGYRTTVRVRRDHFEVKDGKPQGKYISAWGDRKHLFFPPGAARLIEDSDVSIALVEAEKSVMALDAWAARMRQKLLPIGMGGCWGYLGKIGRKTNSHGAGVDETGPLADLDYVNGGKVYVLLDANVSTNKTVKKAQSALVRELKRRNCEVLICALPVSEQWNGPDDYIAVAGDEAMLEVFARAIAGKLTHEFGDGGFEVDETGVWYKPNPDKDGNPRPAIPLCAPLQVVAMTRTSQNKEWGRLLEYRDQDEEPHRLALPLEHLRRDGGTEALCLLESEGLRIGGGKMVKELLPAYIREWPTDYRARCVSRPGWVSTSGGTVYVLPEEVIGSAREPVVFQNLHSVEPAFSSSGTVEEWKQNIAAFAAGNSRLVFSLSCAFAGPLLGLVGEQSGGFHLRGLSSIGKTTTLDLGASVWGPPQKYRRTWRRQPAVSRVWLLCITTVCWCSTSWAKSKPRMRARPPTCWPTAWERPVRHAAGWRGQQPRGTCCSSRLANHRWLIT